MGSPQLPRKKPGRSWWENTFEEQVRRPQEVMKFMKCILSTTSVPPEVSLLFVRRWISPSPERTEKMKPDPWNILKGRKMMKMCNSILYPPVCDVCAELYHTQNLAKTLCFWNDRMFRVGFGNLEVWKLQNPQRNLGVWKLKNPQKIWLDHFGCQGSVRFGLGKKPLELGPDLMTFFAGSSWCFFSAISWWQNIWAMKRNL